jgi:hypothetical protein
MSKNFVYYTADCTASRFKTAEAKYIAVLETNIVGPNARQLNPVPFL